MSHVPTFVAPTTFTRGLILKGLLSALELLASLAAGLPIDFLLRTSSRQGQLDMSSSSRNSTQAHVGIAYQGDPRIPSILGSRSRRFIFRTAWVHPRPLARLNGSYIVLTGWVLARNTRGEMAETPMILRLPYARVQEPGAM